MTTASVMVEGQRLFGPEMRADPYPFYERWRAAHPVIWVPALDAWLVTSYDGVAAALRNPLLVPDRFERIRKRLTSMGLGTVIDETLGPFSDSWDDPAKSARLRALLSKAFAPSAVTVLEARIQYLTDVLLDAADSRGHMDIIRDLANPLPVTVIAEMLGVPVADRDRLKQWSDEISIVLSGDVATLAKEDVCRARAARSELVEYFRTIVARRRQRLGNDLLTLLVFAKDDDGQLAEDDVYNAAVLLLIAGNTTTTNLIGNGALALLRNPTEQRQLRDNRTLAASAVEETLRFDSPVQLTTRLASAETAIQGIRIGPGQWVYLVLAAANRDPVQFPDPDRFHVGRVENKHLSFSAGPHACLGAPLARLEAQVALRTLWRRFPRLRLATPTLEYQPNFNMRGLKTLPVSF